MAGRRLDVSLKLPGSDVQLMLVAGDGAESSFGPLFVLDDVRRFNAQRPRGLRVTAEPQEIPGGYLATFEDPSGTPSTSWTSRSKPLVQGPPELRRCMP
jgi:hypothetical protein